MLNLLLFCLLFSLLMSATDDGIDVYGRAKRGSLVDRRCDLGRNSRQGGGTREAVLYCTALYCTAPVEGAAQ